MWKTIQVCQSTVSLTTDLFRILKFLGKLLFISISTIKVITITSSGDVQKWNKTREILPRSVIFFFLDSVHVCSLVHDVKSTMSLQKSGKSDQKSLLSMIKPPTYRGKWRDRVLLKKSLTLWRRLLKTSRNRLLLILLKQVLPTASYLWQETEHICQETATGTGPSRLAALIIICCFTIVKVRMLYKSINKQQDFIKKNTDKVYIRDSYNNWKSMCNQKKRF